MIGRLRVVALVPARAGSKRLPNKNIRLLRGHPLLAYAIGAAQETPAVDAVYVSSEDPGTLGVGAQYGASPILRPVEMASDDSPDIDWVTHALQQIGAADLFVLLRPTSPFRRGKWISRALELIEGGDCDSIRAMRPATEPAAKMWRPLGRIVTPLLPFSGDRAPWHSMPTQVLPATYIQTAALEVGWTDNVLHHDSPSISGAVVCAYLTPGDAPEALDINTPADWERAVQLAADHPEYLPEVHP